MGLFCLVKGWVSLGCEINYCFKCNFVMLEEILHKKPPFSHKKKNSKRKKYWLVWCNCCLTDNPSLHQLNSVSQAMRQKTVSLQSIMQQLLLLFYCLNKGITWHQIAYYITNIFTVFKTEPRSLSHNFVVFGGTMGSHCCWIGLIIPIKSTKKCRKIYPQILLWY